MIKILFLVATLFSAAFAHAALVAPVDEDIVAEAKAKLDAGDCAGALVSLARVSQESDESNQLSGWAHFCLAGATIDRIVPPLGTYVSGGSLTPMGELANRLLPLRENSMAQISEGLVVLKRISAVPLRDTMILLGALVEGSAEVAALSHDRHVVRRADIAPASCLNADCAIGSGCPAGLMSDEQAIAVGRSFLVARAASVSFPEGSSLRELAERLGGAVESLTPSRLRCVIYNQILAE